MSETIGILPAGNLGRLSQMFCIHKMKDAGISNTLVYTRFYSSGVGSDYRVASENQLVEKLKEFPRDAVAIVSSNSKMYKTMSVASPEPGCAIVYRGSFSSMEGTSRDMVMEALSGMVGIVATAGTMLYALSGMPAPVCVSDTGASFGDGVVETGSGCAEGRGGRVIVGLASYPARERGMLEVVKSISPQCDEMHVSLNEYHGEKLDSVLEKLKQYKNVVVKAYNGEDDLGCQNKFRAVDLCGPDDYFLTVDDDILYPGDYVSKIIDGVNRYHGMAVVSFHGSILEYDDHGKLAKRVLQFRMPCSHDTRVHIAGAGVCGCMPGRIGLTFEVFDQAKNTGDDELLAIWASRNHVKAVVAEHPRGWLEVNELVEKNGALWRDSSSHARRMRFLAENGPWVGFDKEKVFFRVIIPVYGSRTLGRALTSISCQTFDDYKVVVCDDHSPDDEKKANRASVERILGKNGLFIDNLGRRYAGGARNFAMDAGVDSEYTLFLDSDDVFVYPGLFSELKKFILEKNMPDVVVLPFFHHSGRSTRMDAAGVTSPARLAAWRYVAPWTKCVRSSLCQRFQEGLRRSNDVMHHLKTADSVSTVDVFGKEAVRYMRDGETTMFGDAMRVNAKSADAIGDILVVAGSVLLETWKHDYMRSAVAKTTRMNITRGYPDAMKIIGGRLEDYVKVEKHA